MFTIRDETRLKANDIAARTNNHLETLKRSRRSAAYVTAWFDLLGFKNGLGPTNWIDDNSSIARADALHLAALDSQNATDRIVQMNDAVVIARELPDVEPKHQVATFLDNIDRFFELTAAIEIRIGGAGIRGVVAVGNQLNLEANHAWFSKSDNERSPCFCSPRPIHMNTAFSKAYVAENRGRLEKRSSLYVEKELIDDSKLGVELPGSWARHGDFVTPAGTFVLVRRIERMGSAQGGTTE